MLKPLVFLSTLIIVTGCASASYKARSEGDTDYGYEQKQIADNRYSLDYYGARKDSYEKLEAFWYRRAQEICQSRNYQSDIKRETYSGKTFILLPVFMYYDKSRWPMLKGELTCKTNENLAPK